MSRRQIREEIFRLLFGAEFFDREELPGQMERELAGLDRIIAADSDEHAGDEAVDSKAVDGGAGEEEMPASEVSAEDAAYIHEKLGGICAHLDEIDEMINIAATGWKTTRMAKAELAIIRLAVYEMKYEEDMPVSVAINEAVELAKTYGTEKGPAFVNGVLAKLA
ncbi:MAG: transcription antitermination factor NusB [Clostridiales bacterium]|nr:transcription antitermination factor NusB [Clostridiales bacterium]